MSESDFHANKLHYLPSGSLSSGASELEELINMESDTWTEYFPVTNTQLR